MTISNVHPSPSIITFENHASAQWNSMINDMHWIHTEYVYMDISNLIIDLILNKTIFWLRCLHEFLLEYSFHVHVLHVKYINRLMAHVITSPHDAIQRLLQNFTYKHIVRLRYDAIYSWWYMITCWFNNIQKCSLIFLLKQNSVSLK